MIVAVDGDWLRVRPGTSERPNKIEKYFREGSRRKAEEDLERVQRTPSS